MQFFLYLYLLILIFNIDTIEINVREEINNNLMKAK